MTAEMAKARPIAEAYFAEALARSAPGFLARGVHATGGRPAVYGGGRAVSVGALGDELSPESALGRQPEWVLIDELLQIVQTDRPRDELVPDHESRGAVDAEGLGERRIRGETRRDGGIVHIPHEPVGIHPRRVAVARKLASVGGWLSLMIAACIAA